VTLHRPSNVDSLHIVKEIARALEEIARTVPLIFPIHPRTLNRGKEVWQNLANVQIVEPLGYLEFLGLMAKARAVITDSGGIQEETTALGVPCVTIRDNTERPITVSRGTNQLVRTRADRIITAVALAVQPENFHKAHRVIDLWDGHASERIVDVLQAWEMTRAV
jgi:UDP-N-acetylglucosamine 2-epimerase (non-hydrolysing)